MLVRIRISPPFEGGESAKRWGGSQGTAQRTDKGALRGISGSFASLGNHPTRFASLPSFKRRGVVESFPRDDLCCFPCMRISFGFSFDVVQKVPSLEL